MKNRFVIENCGFLEISGGIRVMNYLPALLHSIGANVATRSTCYYNPLLPVVGTPDPEDIAVYPEIIAGHPMGGCSRIVRYLLYLPPHRFAANECPIVYMPEFMEGCRKQCDGPIGDQDIVPLPHVDFSEWMYPEQKTIENLLFEGVKRHCSEAPDLPCTKISQLPNDNPWVRRQATLSAMRRARNFYTMDHMTLMEVEAALCGCRVFHVHGKNDFREQNPDPKPWIMEPRMDRHYAIKFLSIVKRFFGL